MIPATPSNIGVFQLATISVLTTGFGVGAADALAYGVILQAVEIATAVALGLPALVREGVTWQDMRLRALSAAPVRLRPSRRADRERRAERRLGPRRYGAAILRRPSRAAEGPGPEKPPQPPSSPERGTVRQPGSMEVSTSAADRQRETSSRAIRERVVVFDGGMGATLEQFDLTRRTTAASRASATRRWCSTAPT